MADDEKNAEQYNSESAQRDKLGKGQTYQGQARPARPLGPEQLEPSPPEFQTATQGARDEREEPEAHATTQLSSLQVGRKPGKPSSGKHPTTELHIKPRGRR